MPGWFFLPLNTLNDPSGMVYMYKLLPTTLQKNYSMCRLRLVLYILAMTALGKIMTGRSNFKSWYRSITQKTLTTKQNKKTNPLFKLFILIASTHGIQMIGEGGKELGWPIKPRQLYNIQTYFLSLHCCSNRREETVVPRLYTLAAYIWLNTFYWSEMNLLYAPQVTSCLL